MRALAPGLRQAEDGAGAAAPGRWEQAPSACSSLACLSGHVLLDAAALLEGRCQLSAGEAEAKAA